MPTDITDPEFLAKHQYASPENLRLRQVLFEFQTPKISISEQAIKHLKLSGKENILDVGCGEGKSLIYLKHNLDHQGKLVGVDLSKGMFKETEELAKKENLNIRFVEASADTLPFPDECFDAVFSFFMIYHMPSIPKAFKEWARVLKKDGILVIATNGENNRKRMHHFKEKIGEITNTNPPVNFSAAFNLENAEIQLQKTFNIIDKVVFESKFILNQAQPYLDSLQSFKSAFSPSPKDNLWQEGLAKIKLEIEEEIKMKGKFVDSAESGFFICKNKKDS
ncbi:MAG: class I SAM-dependent methyltransferase [Candidatus Micrarchaeota archaeon]